MLVSTQRAHPGTRSERNSSILKNLLMYLYVTCCIYAHPYFQNFGNDTKEIHLFWRGPAPFQYKVTQAKSSKANWIFLAVLHDSPKYQKKFQMLRCTWPPISFCYYYYFFLTPVLNSRGMKKLRYAI